MQQCQIANYLNVSSSVFDSNPTSQEKTLQLAVNATCMVHRANKTLHEDITHSHLTSSFSTTLKVIGEKSLENFCDWLTTSWNSIHVAETSESFNFNCDSEHLDRLCGHWDTFMLYKGAQLKVTSFKDAMATGNDAARNVDEGNWILSIPGYRCGITDSCGFMCRPEGRETI